jgi:hypothetical protein
VWGEASLKAYTGSVPATGTFNGRRFCDHVQQLRISQSQLAMQDASFNGLVPSFPFRASVCG